MLERLDKKVSGIIGEPYRVAEWFTSAEVDSYIAQAAIDPIRQSTQCSAWVHFQPNTITAMMPGRNQSVRTIVAISVPTNARDSTGRRH